MDSNSEIYYPSNQNDDCIDNIKSIDECPVTLKCSYPISIPQVINLVTTDSATATSSSPSIYIAVINPPNNCCSEQRCISLDFAANLTATVSAYAGIPDAPVAAVSNDGTVTLTFQLYKINLCNSKAPYIPIGNPFTYSVSLNSGSVNDVILSSNSSISDFFGFSVCDYNNDCDYNRYSYVVAISSYTFSNTLSGTFGANSDGYITTSVSINNPTIKFLSACCSDDECI